MLLVRKRKKIFGTKEKPRLSVFKSLRHISVQAIDDLRGKTLASVSTTKKGLVKYGGNLSAAKAVGKLIAEKVLALGVKEVVFDRGQASYRGRLKALAEAAREGGLKF